MKHKRFLVALLMLGNTAFSQKGITIHTGVSIPLGDFKGTEGVNAYYAQDGFASTGLGLGIRYEQVIGEHGFGYYGSLNILRNGLQKAYRKEFENDILTESPVVERSFNKMKHLKYLNIPISAGLHYEHAIGKAMAFANLGATLNILKMTKRVVDYNGHYEPSSTDGGYPEDFTYRREHTFNSATK
ncbi:MAG: hypothetical protein MI810_01970, partial [Flavobacteriales bacterium]|nr:hypothetical protein [Flavobacteriales bacterium]